MLVRPFILPEEYIDLIGSANCYDINALKNNFLDNFKMQTFVYGNIK